MRILLTLLALASFLPLPAQAYMTPEEVLESGDFVDPPPNARNAEAARAAQEAEYDARAAAEAEEEAAQAEDESTPDDNTIDDLHGSADDEEVIDWDPEGTDLSADERRDERVLDRVERNRLDDMAQADNGVVLHGSAGQEPLHGGAPLAPTGAGTVVSILAIAAATGFTIRKALRA
jgi:hypothetical protein